MSNWRRNNNSSGNPPWKTGAALRFRPLRRDFLQDCWRSKAALKLKSSTTQCCWDDTSGLPISKRFFTGLRLIFLFLDFPEETRKLLGTGTITEGALTGTYSTRPSSAIFEILTPDRDAEPSDDGLMPPTAYHCSCEPFIALRRSTAWSTQAQTSSTTCGRDAVSTRLHGSKTALLVMLSQIAADLADIVTPESEKKFRWVKCGLLTKPCTQSRAPRTSSSLMMTRSSLMTNFSPKVTGPRSNRAVSWKTYKKWFISDSASHQVLPLLVTKHTLNRCWRAWKPACEEKNDRTSPMSMRLLVKDRSSCRCSWTKDWYSARQASISLPSTHPRSKSPSNNKPNKCRGAWSSPPMMIAGQKQLSPCPTLERAGTVDSTEVVNSSRNLRASRWNSFFK